MSIPVEITADLAHNAGSCLGCDRLNDNATGWLLDKRVWVITLARGVQIRACDDCLQELQNALDGVFARIMSEIGG